MANSTFDLFKRFVVKKFWPWFIQHAWPIIKEEVISSVSQVLSFMRKRLEDFLNDRSSRQQEELKTKVEEAESKADAATDEVAAARWRGKAEAYREHAENLKAENDKLRKELDQLLNEEMKNIQASINDINVELKDSRSLGIGSRNIPLLEASKSDLEEN